MECSIVEIFNPYQPDPDDPEIVFGRCGNPLERSKEMHRKTIITREKSIEDVDTVDRSCDNSLFELPSIRSEDFSASSEQSISSFVQIEDAFSRSVSVVSETSSTRSSLFDSAFIAEESFVSKPNSEDKNEKKLPNTDKAEIVDPLEVLRRIENRIEHFRNKFHLSSAYDKNEEPDSSHTCREIKVNVRQNIESCDVEDEKQRCQSNLVGDRTMAFIKEVKKSTNYGKSGMPALITHEVGNRKGSSGSDSGGGGSMTEKLTPMVDENETECLDRISSTPIVIKHLRPLTLSGNKNENSCNSRFKGRYRTLPHVLPSMDTKSKTPAKFVEPVVVKRAFKF